MVFIEQRELRRIKSFDVGLAAGEYLGLRVDIDTVAGANGDDEAATEALRVRYGAALEELRRNVVAEPGVAGVTFVDELPRMHHREGFVEVDVPAMVGAAAHPRPDLVSFARIDPSYFSVLKTPILAGRAFNAGDLWADSRVVIVDQGFVDQVLGGRNPIGRRLRFVDIDAEETTEVEPWLQIVGVVRDLGMAFAMEQHRAAGVYLPADLAYGPFHMMVHAPGDPMALGARVREIAAGVDPLLRLSDLQRVDEVASSTLWIVRMWLRVSLLLTAIAVLLSLAGIYAVLSFTVSRRTREIGVRVALGASRRRLVVAIFRRPLTHVIGVVTGGFLIALLAYLVSQGDGGLGRIEAWPRSGTWRCSSPMWRSCSACACLHAWSPRVGHSVSSRRRR